MQNVTEMLETIATERVMAQSIVNKCRIIEQLIQQNAMLMQRDVEKSKGAEKCQTAPNPSN